MDVNDVNDVITNGNAGIDTGAILQKIYENLGEYGLKILAAIIILIVGRWIAQIISKLVERAMLKAKVDVTLASFARHLSYIALLVFVVIAAVNKLGVDTASFAVVVGAAGLAIGFARARSWV